MTTITSTVSSLLNTYLENKTTSTTSSTKETDTSVKRYLDSTASDKVDAKTLFSKLSIDVGGDSKTITKDELNSYISSADKGTVKIGDNELSALKTIQSNWDDISGGSDSISYYNVSSAGYSDTLKSMASTDSTTTDTAVSDLSKLTADSTANAYGSIVNAALGTATNADGSTSSLTTLLNTLLKGTTDENDDANANMIATLTNLIAGTTSTVETEA